MVSQGLATPQIFAFLCIGATPRGESLQEQHFSPSLRDTSLHAESISLFNYGIIFRFIITNSFLFEAIKSVLTFT
jgi:hypothetical protein